ncbi:proto-oncogene tyrosine-protein kinase ROS-like [Ptychodera flava]|uniref:proto-oncogene tyrosine-protein kinase ROS-like n=1 Tax=Ptychodera flava TaxID=63121 RepID=UPI00396A41FD
MTVGQVIAIDQSDAGNPMLYFADANEGHLWRSDTAACHCQVLFDANSVEKAGLPPDSLTVDHRSVFWTNNLEGVLNSIDKEDGGNFQTQSINDVSSVIAYGDNLQPMPGIECLAPGPYHETIENPSSTSDSLTLNLQPVTWPPQCSGISTAPVTYTVHYGILAEDIGLVQTCNKNFTCQEVSSFNETVVLEDLEPYTWYLIQASLSNFYTQGLSPLSDVVNFRTDPGVPSAVEGVNVNIRTSYVANITWLPPSEPNGPLDEIQYRVVYRTDDLPASAWFDVDEDISIFGVTIDGFFLYLTNLLPGKTYYFKVRAYPGESEEFSESEEVRNTTFLEPDDVLLVEETNTTLNVSWTAPYDNSVLRHSFKYQEPGETIWKTQTIPDAEKAGNNTYYNMIGENVPLRPNTAYKVRVDVVYITHNIYEWPPNKIFPEFTTLPGVPDIPGKPYFEEIQSQEEISIWQVKWNEPNDNGDEIYQYDLQYSRVMAKYNWSSDGNWTTVYNESKNEWSVSGLDTGVSYIFRVCAINDIGSSNYSQHSHIFNVTKPVPPKEDNIDLIIIIAVTAAVGLALIVVIIVCCCITIRRNNKAPKTGEGTVHFDVDRELATLRTLPNSLVRESNVLYGVGNLPPGDIDLPLFPREKLKLVTFLGSGAFGEVYEGVAMDIVGDNAGETKVAVKTLRKGATDQEKEEFLKEAQLMSNFKHPHILQLLGVCLDNDPQFIILELMEAGDLLSYLRSCRPTAASPATLGCLDLIEISIDVCKGCTYLEEMHFVHRDLAARNCLVSHRDPRFRSVKIGDFGLARDIYKNDYYRKEGEGLLPVRWMSPESLVDGVFTIQSDLWSFGVLLWEIMTLGQQPYPARTNVEVLHFVTTGGRLSRPDNCPDDVHQLMLKCWHNDPEGRPTFRYLLQKLETYKRKSLTMDGIDNMAFDGPVNYSKIRQQAETSVEDEEGYLEPVDSKQSLKSRGSYRTELLSESSGIGSGSSLKPPTPKPSPLLGKKFPGASGHDTSQGSPRLDGRRSGKFSALENPAFDRERSTHNPRYAMDVSVTPRSTPLATPRSTPTSSRKVLYHDNKAFLPDDDDVLENSKDSMKSSLSKATGKNLVGRKDSGSKPSSFSKATGASLFGGKGVGRQSSLTKSSTPNTNSQPNSVSKATGRGMQPSSLSKATGKNAQPNSLSKATAGSAADTSSQHGSVSKGTGAGFTANNVSNPSSKRHPNPFRKDNLAEESKESGASGGARPYENVGKGGSTRRKDKDPKYENVNSKKSNPPKEQIVARI